MAGSTALFIFSGAREPTGAFIAAYREARLLSEVADVTLVVVRGAKIDASQYPGVRLLELPLATTRITPFVLLAYPFALLRSSWALRRALAEADCLRLQVNDFYFLEGAVARLLGYRGQIVTWVRLDPRMLGAFGKLCLGVASRVSSQVVAVSHYIASLVPPAIDLVTLYDPVPSVEPSERPDLEDHRLLRFLFVGNFNENKGQDLAIRAFELVAGGWPHAELHFYGGDLGLQRNRDYLARLREMAAVSGFANRIHFHGFSNDMASVHASAFAALNLSKSESFSLACQEASAFGLPVIATLSGGPAEIIVDGETGYLVPVGDHRAVAERMKALLADPARAKRMGRRGAALVRERFSAKGVRQRLIEMFRLPNAEALRSGPA